MHDDAPAPETPDERWRAWLAAAAGRVPLPVPARSPEDLLAQAGRAERLAAGAEEAPLEPGDLELLSDLACAEAAWQDGRAAAPSTSVMAAAVEAFGAAAAPSAAAPAASSNPGPGAAPASAPRERVLRARAAGGHRRLPLLLGTAVVLVALAWGLAARLSPPPYAGPDEVAQAELERAFAASLAVDAVPLSGQVAPFVDARLWRSLEGRAWRGGESLALAPAAPPALAAAPAAQREPGAAEAAAQREAGAAEAAATADVVLAWRPDASMADAAGLRVHLRGPAGLRVALPDLGVEGVLVEAAEAGGSHVDLRLPGGWAGSLEGRELRLAFTWPRPAAGAASPAGARPEALFSGVSLSTWRVAEGG